MMIVKTYLTKNITVETLKKKKILGGFRRADDLNALAWEVMLHHWKRKDCAVFT